MADRKCACCDSTEHLRDSHGKGGANDLCRPCFHVWYDGLGYCQREDCHGPPHVHGEDIGAFVNRARQNKTWPFRPDGTFGSEAHG